MTTFAPSLSVLPSLSVVPTPAPRAFRPAVTARDAVAFRRGLTTLVPELRARAMRLCKDPALADDLAHDAVERALRFEAQYQRGSNLRAWAYQILFSVFVTRYRRRRRERNALRVLGSDPCAWTTPDCFGEERSAVDLTPSTRRELSALPDGFRDVVVLVDLEERSYREAASELGLPLGTVMSRLHRGRKMLAERLKLAA